MIAEMLLFSIFLIVSAGAIRYFFYIKKPKMNPNYDPDFINLQERKIFNLSQSLTSIQKTLTSTQKIMFEQARRNELLLMGCDCPIIKSRKVTLIPDKELHPLGNPNHRDCSTCKKGDFTQCGQMSDCGAINGYPFWVEK
jgi:hypothetical protein